MLNPAATLCAYGLYAPLNATLLRGTGVGTVLGGEFESGLVELARSLSRREASVARQTVHLFSVLGGSN